MTLKWTRQLILITVVKPTPNCSARDSNRFTVSVNVEPQQKATFNLTYEELLTRRLGEYSHVVNLHPGQVVRDLQVDVSVSESRNITVLRVPELRSGNEIDPDQDKKGILKFGIFSSTMTFFLFWSFRTTTQLEWNGNACGLYRVRQKQLMVF